MKSIYKGIPKKKKRSGMACMNMYNSDPHHQSNINMMSGPRISFSNDFVLDSSGPSIKHERPEYRIDLSAPDFEFSSFSSEGGGGGGSNGSHSMIAADEVFFKGRILPLKQKMTTLRDELLEGEDGGGGEGTYVAQSRPSRIPIRWKELLGLRKAPPSPVLPNKNRDDKVVVNQSQGFSGDEV